MASLNKAMILGNLGGDPEVKNVNGQDVCKFSVATTDKYMKDGKNYEQTEWHKVTIWGKLASNCARYLKKGSKVYLEGKLKTHKWEKDGVTRYSTEITVFQVLFLDSKDDAKKESTETNFPPAEPMQEHFPDEDPNDFSNIPF